MQFDRYTFDKSLRQQVERALRQKLETQPQLQAARTAVQRAQNHYQTLRNQLADPALYQRLLREKEEAYLRKAGELGEKSLGDLPMEEAGEGAAKIGRLISKFSTLRNGKDFLQAGLQTAQNGMSARLRDSLAAKSAPLTQRAGTVQDTIDRLRDSLVAAEAIVKQRLHTADSVQSSVRAKAAALQQAVQSGDYRQLQRLADSAGVPQKEDKLAQFLSGFRSIGLGRSMVSYSELTVWNLNVTGINAEYNAGGRYAALAAGKVDFGFRNLLRPDHRGDGQTILVGRWGWGNRDKTALIFSAFTGRRQNYYGPAIDSLPRHSPVNGYSVEFLHRPTPRGGIALELAKTTKPISLQRGEDGGAKSLWKLDDHSNLALSAKADWEWRRTGTSLRGSLTKMGAQYQAFSLYSLNTDQLAWNVQAGQTLWKRRVSLVASLRRNDFANPYIDRTFRSSTVFKSVQATLRAPGVPVVSVGYFPGSQVFVAANERLQESMYYTFNATAFHTYRIGPATAVSSVVYNRYVNESAGAGFVAYEGHHWLLSQNAVLGNLTADASYAHVQQPELTYESMEAGFGLALGTALRVGAATRCNAVRGGGLHWGSRGELLWNLRRIGSLRMQYEKSYLPTVQRTLFPVESGRLTWYKTF